MRLLILMGAAGSVGRIGSVYVYVWEQSLLAGAPRGVAQQSERAEINPRLHHQSAPSRCPLPKHAAAAAQIWTAESPTLMTQIHAHFTTY